MRQVKHLISVSETPSYAKVNYQHRTDHCTAGGDKCRETNGRDIPDHNASEGVEHRNIQHSRGNDPDSRESIPIDYRIYDKDINGKTKNTHFCNMLSLVKQCGLYLDVVVMDTWYSSLKNLKAIRDHEWIWVMTLRKNRKINRNVSLETLEIPEEGLKVDLYYTHFV